MYLLYNRFDHLAKLRSWLKNQTHKLITTPNPEAQCASFMAAAMLVRLTRLDIRTYLDVMITWPGEHQGFFVGFPEQHCHDRPGMTAKLASHGTAESRTENTLFREPSQSNNHCDSFYTRCSNRDKKQPTNFGKSKPKQIVWIYSEEGFKFVRNGIALGVVRWTPRSENLVHMFLYQKLKIYQDKARNIYVRNTFVERDTSTAVLGYEQKVR